VLTLAGAALHLSRDPVGQGNYDVGCILAAFGAAGLDRVAGRKCGALHSATPSFGIRQVWPIKTREMTGI
jgi:hypothetical protein